jgi:hypothetical protein
MRKYSGTKMEIFSVPCVEEDSRHGTEAREVDSEVDRVDG